MWWSLRTAVRGERGAYGSASGLPGLASAALLFLAAAAPARALVIVPVFDSSITSLANAATVESAFNAAAAVFDRSFSNPATIRINVSWGSVGGRAIPTGDIGASLSNLSSGWTYSEVTGYLRAAAASHPSDLSLAAAVAHLSATDPTKTNNFAVPYGEAQALGMLPAKMTLAAGSIGFKAGTIFDFNPVGGISAGAYDFQGLAQHEIDEVLGRITGLHSGAVQFATPFDLFRYAGNGVHNFSYLSSAYFSVNGGLSKLGNFNYSGGGDRSDWLTLATSNDIQNAYFSTGKALSISASDLTALDILGWGSFATSQLTGVPLSFDSGTSMGNASVPEPAVWAMLLWGFGLVGASARRRRAYAVVPIRRGRID